MHKIPRDVVTLPARIILHWNDKRFQVLSAEIISDQPEAHGL